MQKRFEKGCCCRHSTLSAAASFLQKGAEDGKEQPDQTIYSKMDGKGQGGIPVHFSRNTRIICIYYYSLSDFIHYQPDKPGYFPGIARFCGAGKFQAHTGGRTGLECV